ncbi:transposase [Vibrio parahaemolyticus]|uniref:transposase n=1 Tax=Vibrio parahaemolyticus TaxID=670 RepID=UPI001E50541E|nr:transposase [Vibrio parahaemolyticus]
MSNTYQVRRAIAVVVLLQKLCKRNQVFDLPNISYIKLLRGSAHGVSSTTKACIRNTDRPNLHSFITLQATQHHQSIGKIQSMLKDVFQIHFSTGAISTAHGRVTDYLVDTHKNIHNKVKAPKLIMADETSHQRQNDKR